jgi:hypothetical protein
MVIRVEEVFEFGKPHQSIFLFVIIYYFIYVSMLLLYVFSTAKLTVSTPQGKAQYVAWFIEKRHNVYFERNTDGHHQ